MIDDYDRTMALLNKLEAGLPIPVLPTRAFIHTMRENDIKIKPKQTMQIESVLYLGDEGGIGCSVNWSRNQDSAIITSLTHVRVQNKHPLAKDVRTYQIERTKKLSQITRNMQNKSN